MAKLIFLFATLALCVLMANASIYRTVVELDEEENQHQPWGRCRREFHQHQQLRACQQFIRRQAQRGGRWDEFELDVEEVDDDENQQYPQVLQQCCNQLHRVQREDRQCICPVLRQAAQQQRYQGQIQGPQQVRRLFQAARNLPNICNIRDVGQCPFGAW